MATGQFSRGPHDHSILPSRRITRFKDERNAVEDFYPEETIVFSSGIPQDGTSTEFHHQDSILSVASFTTCLRSAGPRAMGFSLHENVSCRLWAARRLRVGVSRATVRLQPQHPAHRRRGVPEVPLVKWVSDILACLPFSSLI